jgi:hypothetical protein
VVDERFTVVALFVVPVVRKIEFVLARRRCRSQRSSQLLLFVCAAVRVCVCGQW